VTIVSRITREEWEGWVDRYLALIPQIPSVRAQIQGKWRDKSLNALNNWRHSGGNSEYWEFMEFCDYVVERLTR